MYCNHIYLRIYNPWFSGVLYWLMIWFSVWIIMAHFHHGAERGLSVPCRAVPVFGCASTRPSYGPARPGGHFFTSFLARQNCGSIGANKQG